MKIVLFSTEIDSINLLRQELAKTQHLVMDTILEPDQLLQSIARIAPHALIVYSIGQSSQHVRALKQIRILFPELAVWETKKNRWQASLQKFLAQRIQPPTPRPYAQGNRLVGHDASLEASWEGKLNRPERSEGWEQICGQQEARFVLQLQTARQNHLAARRYYECLMTQQFGLNQELGYRLVHGSYKALSWSRDLAAKWLGLLAHYVSGVELEYLPSPVTPGPLVDFVHQDITSEGMYAIALVIGSKVKPSVEKMLWDLTGARFDNQDDDSLLALSLKLYGTARMLEQVGRAQVELMDVWLNPAGATKHTSEDEVPRDEARNAGIYRDFWDLTFIVHSPTPLQAILAGFHAGTTRVEGRSTLPPFAEFRQFCQQSLIDELTQK